MKTPFLLFILFLFVLSGCFSSQEKSAFSTNEIFIKELNNSLNVSNAQDVFRYIFSQLDKEVTVYPTENYYYFTFLAQGKEFRGALWLAAVDRDEGILRFGYVEVIENNEIFENTQRFMGIGIYSEQDGVSVEKINNFTYYVIFEGKKIIFHLNDADMHSPTQAQLLKEEVFVGPVFDESGLQFFLVYNTKQPHLYFILNEDKNVSETFDKIRSILVLGRRTQFVFYNDQELNRKILIGVKKENTQQNNWYDGPFDQMPDNYIYSGLIPKYKEYVEMSYPQIKGSIDQYGNYLHKKDARIAIMPYTLYTTQEDFQFVNRCKSISDSKTTFYICITQQKEYLS
ncbi:MAG: hypothetical protein Q8L34_01965 [Candidatus Woesearchaeota archaeon]|nr:hypothetical protein [Candidatus Woesearchaeota archaeon]